MRTIETTVYTYDELSEAAQERAVDSLRDINVDCDWWEYTYEDFKTLAAMIGVNVYRIYFSGFASQGDGACFEGSYIYRKGGLSELKEAAPAETELHRIASELQDTQRKAFYSIEATVKHRGHYYHELCTDIQTADDTCSWESKYHQSVVELLRELMQWLYGRLETEHEYLISNEAVAESIEANEYEFTESGKIA